MKPQYALIIVMLMILAAILAGHLSDSEAPAEGEVRLVVASRLWTKPAEQEFVRQEIIPAFEKEQGCKVELQALEDQKLFDRIQVQHKSGEIRTDVVVVYVSRMRNWVDAGYVIDLGADAGKWSGRTFSPGFRAMTVFDGKQYFLPIGADDYLLCANKKALKYLPAGVDVQEITWEQLVDWALAVAKGEKGGKFAVTGKAQKMLIYQMGAAILSYGGGFPDVASKEALQAWRMLVKLKGALTPTVQTYDTVISPMKSGEAWLTVTHNARVGDVYASNPTQFIIAPAPKGPAGRGSIAGVSGLAIVKGAPNPKLAAKFLAYLTRPEIQVKLSKGTGGFIPTVKEASKLLGDSAQDEVIRKSIAVLNQGRLAYIPPVQNWGAIKTLCEGAFVKLVLRDGAVDEAFLKQTQAKIDVELKRK